MAASMGSLLAAGAKGKRFALPNVMIHQPLGGAQDKQLKLRLQQIIF